MHTPVAKKSTESVDSLFEKGKSALEWTGEFRKAWLYFFQFYPNGRARRAFLEYVHSKGRARDLAEMLAEECYRGRFPEEKVVSKEFLNTLKPFLMFDHQSLPTLRRNFHEELRKIHDAENRKSV